MSKPLDRLALLENFVRIADRGSISAAARDLGIAQGSCSRRLKDLEARLGVQLIRRTTHSLALTDAGLDVLAHARDLIARWDAMEERHAPDAEVLRGPLRIIAPVGLGQLHLADIAIAFQTANPEVVLNWRLEDDIIRFAEVGCDCWIKVGSIPDETLIVRCLGRVERRLFGTPDLAATLAEPTPAAADHLPIVALTPFEGGKIELTHDKGEKGQLQSPVCMATNNIMSLKRAVMTGVGAAVLPRWFVSDELERGVLVDLLPEWRAPTLEVNVGYLPARLQPRRLSVFLDALETGVRNIPGIMC